MIEATKQSTIIFTDYSAAISIVRQTSINTVSTKKLNLRLIRASEYLQRFRLDVRYKPDKINTIPDALSRLTSREYRPETNESILEALNIHYFPVSLIELSPNFRRRILKGYQKPRWTRVLQVVRDNKALRENAAKLPYRVVNNLLYFDNDKRGLRLCISSSMKEEVFKLAHDEMSHPDYARTHERLISNLYIFEIASKLHEFIRHCPHCQLNQTSRYKLYESLQPILTPFKSFHIIIINFILALPPTRLPKEFDCAISITDKFSKAVTFLSGKTTWRAKDWAIRLLDRLAELNWGLSRVIISDRDRKFVSGIWREIFKALKIDLLYSIAYYPQTNNQSERSNQTAEVALRYYAATLEDLQLWPTVLSRISAALNNSIKYSSTSQSPTQVLYDFRTREALDLLRIDDLDAETETSSATSVTQRTAHSDNASLMLNPPSIDLQLMLNPPRTKEKARPASLTSLRPNRAETVDESFNSHVTADISAYRPAHIDIKDAIAFAALKMKDIYNSHHKPIFFEEEDQVNLRLHRGYYISVITFKKISQQLVDSFRVLKRIGRLAYQLDLSANMQIYNVISIAHLEPTTDPIEDPY